MTEKTNKGEFFYDATCRFCTGIVNPLRPWLAKRDIVPIPFKDGAAENEMRLNWHDGRTFGGADAAIFIARQFWFIWPFAILAMLPGFKNLVHAFYRWTAKNRHCLNGACEIDLAIPSTSDKYGVRTPEAALERPRLASAPSKTASKPTAEANLKTSDFHGHRSKAESSLRTPSLLFILLNWAVFFTLITSAIAIGFVIQIPAWLWMWIISGALWVGFKFMAFRSEGGFKKVNPLFFAWIGTDADAFRYDRAKSEIRTPLWDKFAFVALGLLLTFAILPQINETLAVGWIGVAVMLSLFHFGGFSVLAACWQRARFPVEPIMNAPWVAKTLGEFWGPRWNRAFSDWARIHVFRPFVRKFGVARGTFAGFFVSGITHELAVSLPALGGFGLPMIYFFIQASVLLAQRKFKSLRNRFVTLATVLIPAPILFHPPFIERVFAPMFRFLT